MKIPKNQSEASNRRVDNAMTKNWQRINSDIHNFKQKTKYWATRNSLKTVGELRCSGRICSSFSTCNTRHVALATNWMTSHEWGKARVVIMKNVTSSSSIVIYSRNDIAENWFMVFNATFNNISAISWRYTSPWTGFELTTLVVIGTDCIGSCKSNYHTTTTAPSLQIDVWRINGRTNVADKTTLYITILLVRGIEHPVHLTVPSYWILLLADIRTIYIIL